MKDEDLIYYLSQLNEIHSNGINVYGSIQLAINKIDERVEES